MKKLFLISLIMVSIYQIEAQQYVWTQKADFGGGVRYAAFSFSIGSKGFIGSGITSDGINLLYSFTDFWEYDPSTDVWTQKADVPGSCKNASAGFSIGQKGYLTVGWTPIQNDSTWEYDPTTNVWTTKANYGGGGRYSTASFVIGNYAYVGTGYAPYHNDFWRYDPSLDAWTQIADVGGQARSAANGFSIDGYGYVFGGGEQFSYYSNELWQYDTAQNIWNQKSSCPGAARCAGAAFSIDGYGFVGVGTTDLYQYQDFYRYDPLSNFWTQVDDYGGGTRVAPTVFTIGNKAYVGTGSTDIMPSLTAMSDIWSMEAVIQQNIAQGILYIDANNNQSYDAGELMVKNTIIEGAPGPVYVSSNSTGSYNLPLDSGNFSIGIPNPPAYYTYSPSSIGVLFSGTGQTNSNNNFAFIPIANINDVRVTITATAIPRGGNPDYINVTYKNIGTTVMNGTIDVTLDTSLTYDQTIPADTTLMQNGQLLTYSYNNLLPGESRVFQIRASIATNVFIGDTLNIDATINPVSGDSVPADNYYGEIQPVMGSYDPNDISVNKESITINQVTSGEWLEYTIRFQNTGNLEAINIHVEDTLSPMLDIPSFDLLATSHPCNFLMEGSGIAKFFFPDIHLIDSTTNEPLSHGAIKYRIKVKTNLSLGTVIPNTAGIYFDFNPVVVTNTVLTIVANPTGIHEITSYAFLVAPNPVKDIFYISSNENMKYDISIYNVHGGCVFKTSLAGKKIPVSLKNFASGIYFLQIKNDKEAFRTKLYKE